VFPLFLVLAGQTALFAQSVEHPLENLQIGGFENTTVTGNSITLSFPRFGAKA
jgi:hypothetical protein